MSETIRTDEYKTLRDELHNLKACQITFITLTVSATGALLGFAAGFDTRMPLGTAFLLPLIVIIPFWWIFFDKAITINRAVGYYRALEKEIIEEEIYCANFIGWENALAKFRELQKRGKINKRTSKGAIHHVRIRHKRGLLKANMYWLLTGATFASLAGLCVTLAWYFLIIGSDKQLISWIAIIISTLIVLVSAYYKLKALIDLTYSQNYNKMSEIWREILETNDRNVETWINQLKGNGFHKSFIAALALAGIGKPAEESLIDIVKYEDERLTFLIHDYSWRELFPNHCLVRKPCYNYYRVWAEATLNILSDNPRTEALLREQEMVEISEYKKLVDSAIKVLRHEIEADRDAK